MSKPLSTVPLLTLIALLSGCGAKIFDAKFEQFNGGLGSAAGPVPGSPQGDYIVVEGDERIAQIAGNSLALRQPGAGTSTGGYVGRVYLVSAAISDGGPTRTLSWTGRFTGDTAFDTAGLAADISAQDSSGGIEPWPNQELRVSLSNSEAKLLNNTGSRLEGPRPLRHDETHKVFVSLNTAAGSYSVSIQQPGEPEISWSGSLPAGTKNLLADRSRVVLKLGFPDGVGSATTSSYSMDDVIMRVK